ncbi:MAG: deoxyribodipyrimidine photo-lyase [Bacteroidota bacterium]
MKEELSIFWFRRDLRLDDNAGLYRALKSGLPVLPVFIFDTNILDRLDEKKDARVEFIYDELVAIQEDLRKMDSDLVVLQGKPMDAYRELLEKHPGIKAVYTNTDYEPYARERDAEIADFLEKKGIDFKSFKDIVVLEKDEVLKDNGEPYTVFTPYKNKWLTKLDDFQLKPYPCKKYHKAFLKTRHHRMPTLGELGFERSEQEIPPRKIPSAIVSTYDKTRDYPAIHGTTRLSIHLRFGTVSIRELVKKAGELNATWLSELIWREFYQMILWHFPHSAKDSFKPQYDNIKWRNNEKEFELWCRGETGYPIVDAGMRELNETGFMHNRVRMVTASFLTKHLLIDWRWGEAYFAEKLLDYDMASNVGGWQWAAGSGCDAAPYFRVFNPRLQTEKFDKELKYINKWVPELNELSYPKPMVDHAAARERVLSVYKKALNG